MSTTIMSYQPKTGEKCHCKPGIQRDNCPDCEGTGWRIDFKAIRARTIAAPVQDSCTYQYSNQTVKHCEKVPANVVSGAAHRLGMKNGEPLIIAMDALIRYAEAYKIRFEQPLAEDGFLGDPWLSAAKGVRALLNGDGAIAMERGITTDSKDNGAVESMFWDAMAIAGYKESDL